MKKKMLIVLATLVLLSALVLSVSAESQGWEKRFYVDQFNDPTDEWYLAVTVDGTFSNSVVSEGNASVKLVIDEKDMSLFLLDYGSELVTNPYSESVYYSIAVKDSAGEVYNYCGIMAPKSDRIQVFYSTSQRGISGLVEEDFWRSRLFPEEFKLYELLMGEGALKFAVSDEENALNRYNFVLDGKSLPSQNKEVYAALQNRVENRMTTIYNTAVSFMEQEKYDYAETYFRWLDDFRDSTEKLAGLIAAKNEKIDQAILFAPRRFEAKNGTLVTSPLAYHAVGLKTDGTVIADGWTGLAGQLDVNNWTEIVAVEVGCGSSAGIKADGTVVITGNLDDKELAEWFWEDIVEVSIGINHIVGLKADGTVVAVGYNNGYKVRKGQCEVDDWSDIVAVSAGDSYTIGLKADGTAVTVGYDSPDLSGWRDIVAISSGSHHTVGLKVDGSVVATGDNSGGRCEVSGWSDIKAISAGNNFTMGLQRDGRVVLAGDNSYVRSDISKWSDIVAISAGKDFAMGLKRDGTVVATGKDDFVNAVAMWTDIALP